MPISALGDAKINQRDLVPDEHEPVGHRPSEYLKSVERDSVAVAKYIEKEVASSGTVEALPLGGAVVGGRLRVDCCLFEIGQFRVGRGSRFRGRMDSYIRWYNGSRSRKAYAAPMSTAGTSDSLLNPSKFLAAPQVGQI